MTPLRVPLCTGCWDVIAVYIPGYALVSTLQEVSNQGTFSEMLKRILNMLKTAVDSKKSVYLQCFDLFKLILLLSNENQC